MRDETMSEGLLTVMVLFTLQVGYTTFKRVRAYRWWGRHQAGASIQLQTVSRSAL